MARYIAEIREQTLTYYDSAGVVLSETYTSECFVRDTADASSGQWFDCEAGELDNRRTRSVQRSTIKSEMEAERGIS